MSDDEDDWVEVRRVTDAIGAEMIRDFLHEHEVRVAIRGNPQATRMTWSQTSDAIRIVVAPSDLEKANEVLAAMTAGDAHPFRGAAPIEDPHEKADRFVKPRSAINAAVLAIIVPFGGGHFYARHGAAGTILAAGSLGAIIGVWFGHNSVFARALVFILAADVVGSYWAVKRFNAQRIPAENVQRRWALVAVASAFAAAWLSHLR